MNTSFLTVGSSNAIIAGLPSQAPNKSCNKCVNALTSAFMQKTGAVNVAIPRVCEVVLVLGCLGKGHNFGSIG